MSERSRLRLVVLQVLVLSLFVTLGGRLWYLQVVAGERYEQAATDNRLRQVAVPAVRGQILDDQGRPLVRNRTALVVSVSRTELLRQRDAGTELLQRLGDVIGVPYDELRARTTLCDGDAPKPCWNGSPYEPIPVTETDDTTIALRILERQEEFPGVTAELSPVREFPAPAGANAAHLLGYLSPVTEEELTQQEQQATGTRIGRRDLVGRAGLERQYDDALRGASGVRTVAVDHRGRVSGTVDEQPATPGNHVVTSIDAGIQAAAETQLQAAIDRARSRNDRDGNSYSAPTGAAVVLDHRTGRIVALASYPSYDPAIWVGGISSSDYAAITSEDAHYPNQSRATQGEFAPASTFKVVSTAAAVAAGYDIDGTYSCPSSFQVGNRAFRNYESQAYGQISLERALEISCDTVFYRFAYELWLRDGGDRPRADAADTFLRMAQGFGFGRPTGLDLPAESGGRIADRAWKQQTWEATKETSCRRAAEGYPDVAADDPERAAYLQQIASDNCVDGFKYRGGDAVNFAIGQGDTTITPLQLAVAYGAIANGGTLWAPRIGRAVVRPDGTVLEEIVPQPAGSLPVDAGTLDYIRTALYGTAREGTGRAAFAGFPLDLHPVGVKTGTGEVFGKQTTSWFASFDDRYAIVLMVEEGGTGAGTSGPSVRGIYEAIYGLAGAPPLLPGGRPPEGLPTVAPDGSVAAPP
jgi:penicillin-binding protein 2